MPRERVIGLALMHSYSYYRDILRGISHVAEGRPHWRFISLAPKVGRLAEEVLKQVDVLISCVENRNWCEFVRQARVPIINIDCLVPDLPIRRVGVDNHLIGRIAAQHFLERGLRSFGFVGHSRLLYSIEREHAFRSALAAANHSELSVYHRKDRRDVSRRRDDILDRALTLDRGVGKWLLSLPQPTGIFTPNDLWGVEVIQTCREVGLRVPEDISVLGVDNDDLFCEISRPPLSSVVVPALRIGKKSAELAEMLIESRRRRLPQDVLLPPEGIVVRRSTDVLAISDPDVVAAIRFVRENCHRPLQVCDVLREVPVSRRSLERRTHAALGITLGAEIRRTRFERAKRLLTLTELSIEDVAAQAGFSDYRHLRATFQSELGLTPRQYRRESAQQS